MSVIIRLQNLPWSANALDIRNFFRGLSIPEGGVHIVGGELGDAFIAFSTDEDARQAMMLDGGKIKEIQVKLLLSSRSEMHKVIEAARQSVPILSLAPAPTPAPAPAPIQIPTPVPTPIIPTITPFSAALGTNPLASFGIPGIGNPNEIPQPAVIEPPAPLVSPPPAEEEKEEDKVESKRSRDRRRSRTRSRSRDRDRKDRKRDRRDRSRSRDRRRRDRSRSRDRRDRKRDRKDRSRSPDRSPTRRSRDRRERRSPRNSQDKVEDSTSNDTPFAPPAPAISQINTIIPPQMPPMVQPNMMNMNGAPNDVMPNRFDPSFNDTMNRLQELGKKRNPNAFQPQGDQQNGGNNGGRFQSGRGGGNSFRREGRPSRFDSEPSNGESCVAIRNAPNHTSYGDVRRFFPFVIDKRGIKMINDNLGRRTGNIFVRFCDPVSRQLALSRKNNELKGAEVTVEAIDEATYEAAVDSFLPFRQENEINMEEDQTLVIADDEPKEVYSVLKLTDLPMFVKEHDIIKTFSEFSLLSIMLNECRLSRSKIAYVEFVKPTDAKMAFDRRETYIFGRRHPTIKPISNEDYVKEKNSQNERGPPEIKETNEAMEPQGPRDPRQRRFNNNSPVVNKGAAAQQAQAPNFFAGAFQGQPPPFGPFAGGQPFGGFPQGGPAAWAARPSLPAAGGPAGAPSPVIDLDDEPLDCVLMKGLPREATDRTIVTFLADTGAVPARIHLMLDAAGQPSGDCFCEFRSAQEARQAAAKHGHSLDGCRVTVDRVPRALVDEALDPKPGDSPPAPAPAPAPALLGAHPPPAHHVQQPPFFDGPQRGGFGPRGGGFRGRGGFDGNRGGFDGNRGGFDGNRGGFDGNRGGFDEGRNNFESGRGGGGFDSNRGSFDRGFNRGGFERGNYRGRGYERGGRGFERGRGRGFGRGRGRGPYDGARPDEEPDAALEDFGAPGCVVSMENVPFRASIDDILTFFSEFELTQDDVIRRYNERGQPTGDARVAFRTPFDAQRAVKTRHMDTIHDRRINLNIL